MAIQGAQITFGATATQLSSVVPAAVKQLDVICSTSNNDNCYIGSADVAVTPANVWADLAPGKAWGLSADEGEQVAIGPDAYILGTEGEAAHLIWVV